MFTTNIADNMFTYLKPDIQDRASIESFRLAFGMFEERVEDHDDDYLPEEL